MTALVILSMAMIGFSGFVAWGAVELLREAEAERTDLAAKGRRCGLNPRS